ncbi:ABC transporter permease subunit [Salinibacterium sp. G-O1]|uniref:ABC transporter permease subunit n=1 Tax=Salinibacterium sp. G-O1 TaxID=3046208 RepID=UPI0024B92522|nr:ABC transporter permease subunit [Salinibacterium sp. G-O1]MDJ0336204.1 ABC transporter permease subunit [Salinibacterium sp. G-O1]
MASALPVLRRSFADSWRSLLGWTVGVAGALALYLPLYPSINGAGQMDQMIASMPPELVKTMGIEQISSGPGYVQGTFYGLIGVLLLTIAGTSWGASAIAGAEESGRLELDLAHGVGRLQYALESALSIVVRLLWLGGFAALMVIVLDGPAQLGLDAANVVAASTSLVGLTLVSATMALAVGAITGRRSIATVAGAGVAVLGYVINAVAAQSSDLEGARAISPYAWAFRNTPLVDGFDAGGLVLLVGVSAALTVVAVFALRRRDVVG